MHRATVFAFLLAVPEVALSETISKISHAHTDQYVQIVLEWSDKVAAYDLESVDEGSILWLKTVSRMSVPFPDSLAGWTGRAGYSSGLFRVTFPKTDGAVSVDSLAATQDQSPQLIITIHKKPFAEARLDHDEDSQARHQETTVIDDHETVVELNQFLKHIESRVARGEMSVDEGYRLVKQYSERLVLKAQKITLE